MSSRLHATFRPGRLLPSTFVPRTCLRTNFESTRNYLAGPKGNGLVKRLLPWRVMGEVVFKHNETQELKTPTL